MDYKNLFLEIYSAKDEAELQDVINRHPKLFSDHNNWKPLGENKSNFSVVKNQQSNPIAALIEKATNSIDAILTRRCLEEGIDPKSSDAPQTMSEAIEQFFPDRNWDLRDMRKSQAEEIQIIADGRGPMPKQGRRYDTSIIIYDNGEGQRPEKFEDTFLSLMKGNKNDIQFVQGKYNMGGSGAVVFCGKKRYQLIASKRYNGGEFGFTLVREHEKTESDHAKETWFEYFIPNGKIPSFPIDSLDLGLENRRFTTGTIIKMYSYQLPSGYSGFAQDMNQSVNEYLFNPALPILTKDTKERYPNNNVLVNDLFGLQFRLNNEEKKYLENNGVFTETFADDRMGEDINVSCYVFKNRIGDRSIKKTKKIIQDRYFKNNMSVVFSLNGQVHGHYTSEFITRSLKMNLLKNHLLIHVDCTNMDYDFRKELFMASRDRLKDGEETQYLRKFLSDKLSRPNGRLTKINKNRRSAADVDTSSTTKNLIKNLSQSMPMDSEMMKLLNQAFKIDAKKDKPKKGSNKRKHKEQVEKEPFNPERFPTFFSAKLGEKDGKKMAKIPLGGEKTIKFETDVEDEYFTRNSEPGDLELSVLSFDQNDLFGGTNGTPKKISEVFNVQKSSPDGGTIRVTLNPKKETKVGEEYEVKAKLTSPSGDHEELFWAKISEPKQPQEEKPKDDIDQEDLGLPELVFMYKDPDEEQDSAVGWGAVEEATANDVTYDTVMIPLAEGDTLEKIYINMDASILKNFKSKSKNPSQEQIEIANRKFYTSVYFHTLFLYTITQNRRYKIMRSPEEEQQNDEYVEIGEYLKDLFDTHYSEFLLNFNMEGLFESLGD